MERYNRNSGNAKRQSTDVYFREILGISSNMPCSALSFPVDNFVLNTQKKTKQKNKHKITASSYPIKLIQIDLDRRCISLESSPSPGFISGHVLDGHQTATWQCHSCCYCHDGGYERVLGNLRNNLRKSSEVTLGQTICCPKE